MICTELDNADPVVRKVSLPILQQTVAMPIVTVTEDLRYMQAITIKQLPSSFVIAEIVELIIRKDSVKLQDKHAITAIN